MTHKLRIIGLDNKTKVLKDWGERGLCINKCKVILICSQEGRGIPVAGQSSTQWKAINSRPSHMTAMQEKLHGAQLPSSLRLTLLGSGNSAMPYVILNPKDARLPA